MIKYLAIAHYDEAKYTCETSNLETLMDFLLKHDNTYFEVINKSIGEILCYCNGPDKENYLETNFMYLIAGWMFMNQ